VGNPTGKPEDRHKINDFYTPLVNLTIHGQENKWWMFYIYLLFNSILILSCSTLLTVETYGLVHKIALSLFSVGGILINLCWLFMAEDYVNASNLYSDIAVEAEKYMPEEIRKPLTERQKQRNSKNPFGTMKFIATILPIFFIVIYAIILSLAWINCIR
jgi:cytochrome b